MIVKIVYHKNYEQKAYRVEIGITKNSPVDNYWMFQLIDQVGGHGEC